MCKHSFNLIYHFLFCKIYRDIYIYIYVCIYIYIYIDISLLKIKYYLVNFVVVIVFDEKYEYINCKYKNKNRKTF
jgi:hypothetical protein